MSTFVIIIIILDKEMDKAINPEVFIIPQNLFSFTFKI